MLRRSLAWPVLPVLLLSSGIASAAPVRIGLCPVEREGAPLPAVESAALASLSTSGAVTVVPVACPSESVSRLAEAAKSVQADRTALITVDQTGASRQLRILVVDAWTSETHEMTAAFAPEADLASTIHFAICQAVTPSQCIGVLKIDGAAGSRVFIDGEEAGTTPFNRSLPVGKHFVRLMNGSSESERKETTIVAKQEQSLSVELANGKLAFKTNDVPELTDFLLPDEPLLLPDEPAPAPKPIAAVEPAKVTPPVPPATPLTRPATPPPAPVVQILDPAPLPSTGTQSLTAPQPETPIPLKEPGKVAEAAPPAAAVKVTIIPIEPISPASPVSPPVAKASAEMSPSRDSTAEPLAKVSSPQLLPAPVLAAEPARPVAVTPSPALTEPGKPTAAHAATVTTEPAKSVTSVPAPLTRTVTKSPWHRPAFFATAGAAGALLVSGIIFGIVSTSTASDLNEKFDLGTRSLTDRSSYDTVRTTATIANVSYGLAGLSAVAAGVIFALQPKQVFGGGGDEPSVSVGLSGVSVGGRF